MSVKVNKSKHCVECVPRTDSRNWRLFRCVERTLLSYVINEARLNKLLAQSDDFLNSLNGEIESFDDK